MKLNETKRNVLDIDPIVRCYGLLLYIHITRCFSVSMRCCGLIIFFEFINGKRKEQTQKNQLYVIAPECESHIKWAFVKITMKHDE